MLSPHIFAAVLGLVLLLLAALKTTESPWISFGWSGLFFLFLSQLFLK